MGVTFLTNEDKTELEQRFDNVYTKEEVDTKIGSGGGSSSDLSDYVKKEDIEEINDKLFETYEEWNRLEQSVQWETGYHWTVPVSSNASYKYTNIAVSPGDVITYENVQRAGYSMRFIDAYNGDTRIEAASDNSDTKKYIVPEGVDNVFISILASVVDGGNYTLYITRTEEKQIIRGTKGVNDFIFRNGLWVAEAETLPANTELIVVKNVDNKKNHAYDVYAEFSEFETVTIAHGKEGFQSSYIVIDSTTVKTYHCNSATTSVLMDTFEHGLTFDKFISVHINLEHKNRGLVSILTNGGEYSVDTAYFGGCKNQVSVTGGQDMTNVKASYFVRDVYADTWIFGDSYTSIGDPTKFPQHIINKKYTNFLISGYGGATSVNQYKSLSRLIGMCAPKRICWCLGMNDGDTSTGVNEKWNTVLGEVINLCNNKNVELILTTIPNVPNIRHDFKNQIVRESGYRYIDFAKAVNAETVGSTWYEGMLSSDNVHPSESGAKVLANRILLDVPELTL